MKLKKYENILKGNVDILQQDIVTKIIDMSVKILNNQNRTPEVKAMAVYCCKLLSQQYVHFDIDKLDIHIAEFLQYYDNNYENYENNIVICVDRTDLLMGFVYKYVMELK